MSKITVIVNSENGHCPILGLPMYTDKLDFSEADAAPGDISESITALCRDAYPVEAGIYPGLRNGSSSVTRIVFQQNKPAKGEYHGWFEHAHNLELFDSQRERLIEAVMSADSIAVGENRELIFNLRTRTKR